MFLKPSIQLFSFFIFLHSISSSFFFYGLIYLFSKLWYLVINGITSADLYSPCKNQPAIGAESGSIPNAAFFASSFVQGREPYTARLNGRYGLFFSYSIFFFNLFLFKLGDLLIWMLINFYLLILVLDIM
jgi:hypothetical protein